MVNMPPPLPADIAAVVELLARVRARRLMRGDIDHSHAEDFGSDRGDFGSPPASALLRDAS